MNKLEKLYLIKEATKQWKLFVQKEIKNSTLLLSEALDITDIRAIIEELEQIKDMTLEVEHELDDLYDLYWEDYTKMCIPKNE